MLVFGRVDPFLMEKQIGCVVFGSGPQNRGIPCTFALTPKAGYQLKKRPAVSDTLEPAAGVQLGRLARKRGQPARELSGSTQTLPTC